MEARQTRVIERKARRQPGRRRTVTSRTEPIRVTSRTEIARARRSDAVLADEVALMHDVAVGTHLLAGQIDMAPVARPHCELIFVCVTAEAGRHRREERLRVRLGNAHVTADALAVRRAHVLAVLEAQTHAGALRTLALVRCAVASGARSLIVRFFVTLPTGRVGRQVERALFARRHDP